jgi:polar amino acid transport system substrate-binding protein
MIGRSVLRLIGGIAIIAGVLAVVVSPLVQPTKAQDKRIVVATLEWPPYTSAELPKGGATTAVVQAAFEQMGYEVEVRYWPWKRAIAKARAGADEVVAYFPGYHCNHEPGFIASDSMGDGPLGFAEHADGEFVWTNLDELNRYRIGTVVGYANTEAFDERAADGEIQVITSADDRTNLLKLIKQQIHAAVIDRFVLEYLKRTDPEIRESADQLRFDTVELESKQLFLGFRDDAVGQAIRDQFNEGRIDINAVVDSYFATSFTY